MSGHSKWSTIKRKKGANDAQRAKIFTKIAREISVVVREGGPDPDNNSRLRDVIGKARAANMPNDNINRTIKKAAGDNDGAVYETITYEGYGPKGVAVIVETLTDNRNRTAGDVRHYFDKFGGNLGQTGCVNFMFDRKGIIDIEKTDSINEDDLMMCALEAGADDVSADDEEFEVETTPEMFQSVRDALEQAGYSFDTAQISYVPQTMVTLEDEKDILFMNKLIEALEDNDDVQNIYHNWDTPEETE